jgi:hypothetical protein
LDAGEASSLELPFEEREVFHTRTQTGLRNYRNELTPRSYKPSSLL